MDSKKIETMKAAGAILGEVLELLLKYAKPGVSEIEVDSLAEKLIRERGAEPGFKKVPSYKHTICVSTNDVVVHGVPTKKVLKEGDIVGIDCGVFLNGYYTDMAETIRVTTDSSQLTTDSNDKVEKFLVVGKKALFAGIKEARVGNRVGHISREIQSIIEGAGYSVVRNLVGHGVGKSLHEAPEIPGYLSRKIDQTPELSAGQTLAIEAIYNMGGHEVVYDRGDNWTIATRDRSISGLFERTILVTENGPELLTQLSTDKLSKR
ncbi:MAG: type I methionyl aminopeptidase [Candidatus Levybacteria bacterium]|nr:type I methionyl aminopeptidase [Candidatus Levybacteria bacterium]